ncbi:MAG: iron ABC transporter permease [Bifidobacteriaceae bacterium]|jgi:thiamine transport system permease protein|nr:iron ABC transporter permease [Bifidobacteriaceae bacterium]
MATKCRRRNSGKFSIYNALFALTLIAVTGYLLAFFIVPVAHLITFGLTASDATSAVTSGFSGTDYSIIDKFAHVIMSNRTIRVLFWTVIEALAGCVGSAIIGLPVAYALYKANNKRNTLMKALLIAPFTAPSVAVGIAFKSLFAKNGWLGFLGLDSTFLPVLMALLFFNVGLFARQVGSKWAEIGLEYEEASYSLGASPFQTFRKVTFPLLLPQILSSAFLIFVFCGTAFGVIMTLGGEKFANLESEIYFQTVSVLHLDTAAILAILQILLMLTALFLFNRFTNYNQTSILTAPSTPTRAQKPTHYNSQNSRPKKISLKFLSISHFPHWSQLYLLLITAILIILPLTSLLTRAFYSPATNSFTFSNFLALIQPRDNKLNVSIIDATINSLQTALISGTLSVIIGVTVSLLISRRTRSKTVKFLLNKLEIFYMLPFGISAVTLGFGMLITLNHPLGLPVDLRLSPLIIPIAQSLVAIPIVIRTILPRIMSIDHSIREAAENLGANAFQVIKSVDLPLIRRGIGVSFGFAFAVSLGEFGATSFLARAGNQTLPVLIYRLISLPDTEHFSAGIAGALILIALTSAVMLVAEIMSNE